MLYLQSSLIDLLGLTSSKENNWVYINLSEMLQTKMDVKMDRVLKDINMKKIVDNKHFLYIDTKKDFPITNS